MRRFLLSLIVLTGILTIGYTVGAGNYLSASSVYVHEEIPKSPFKKADTIRLAMTGDIMMGTTYPDTALPAKGGRMLFNDVKATLRAADLAFGNLEGTLCDSGVSRKTVSKISYAFRTPTSMSHLLKDAGYDFLSLANNHSLDFGWVGMKSTEHVLDSLGIRYAGVKGRKEWTIFEKNGLKIGVCAFGHNHYTVLHTDSATVFRVLTAVRPKVDILVVSFHGGAEGRTRSHLPYGKEMFYEENRGNLRDFAHYCVDLGADVVFGHGPHVVRCMELYRNRLIAYSLGNFCTPKGISIAGVSGYAPILTLEVNHKGEFLQGRIVPFIQRWGIGPRVDKTGAVIRQIRLLSNEDIPGNPLLIDKNGVLRRKK